MEIKFTSRPKPTPLKYSWASIVKLERWVGKPFPEILRKCGATELIGLIAAGVLHAIPDANPDWVMKNIELERHDQYLQAVTEAVIEQTLRSRQPEINITNLKGK